MNPLRLPADLAALLGGEGGADGWRLLDGRGALAEGLPPRERRVVLPRLDPRWSIVDVLGRSLTDLPPEGPVAVPDPLGEALLRRARPDLRPLRAGAFPAPEETPALVAGPRPASGPGSGSPLPAAAFPPAPGTGIRLLVAPEGRPIPETVAAREAAEARLALGIEEAFLRGLGPLPGGATVGALARRKVSALFVLEAVLFRPGREPRDLAAEIPVADAPQFARAFGAHLAS